MTGPDRWLDPPEDYAPECPECEGAGLAGAGVDRRPRGDGTGIIVDAGPDGGFWAEVDEAYDRAGDR